VIRGLVVVVEALLWLLLIRLVLRGIAFVFSQPQQKPPAPRARPSTPPASPAPGSVPQCRRASSSSAWSASAPMLPTRPPSACAESGSESSCAVSAGSATEAVRISAKSESSQWTQKTGMHGIPVRASNERAMPIALAILCSE